MSPFALPYAAHLAHLPGAFLMGHPGFPSASLFGGLGEGALGHFPTSLATAQGKEFRPKLIMTKLIIIQ